MLKRALLLAVLALPVHAQPQAWAWDDGTVPYVVTPMEIVERMLRMAEVGKDDHVIDLGSGDGRIIIEAAKRGARGLGVDLDPALVKHATENAQKAGVADRTQFVVKDIFDTDLSGATVVAFYLLPDFNAKLLPRLLKLKPGTRIVLLLLTCGARYAIAERGNWTAQGRWVWWWKNGIDRRWVASFRE